MIPKKLDRKTGIIPSRSLVSPLLKATSSTPTPVPVSEEPWRNKKAKGKNRGRRKK
jgi:hypothetical protein